jgi:hypothetical protein
MARRREALRFVMASVACLDEHGRGVGCFERGIYYQINFKKGSFSYRSRTLRVPAHSCDENKQAITPVGVPPRHFSATSDLEAFCFNSVLSSKMGKKTGKNG